MPELTLRKLPNGALAPFTPDDEAWIQKQKIGTVIKGKWTSVRAPERHRRYFALLNLAFDYFEIEPVQDHTGAMVLPVKNMETFRKWVMVSIGRYDVHGLPGGGVRLVPHSIAFGSMDEDEFTKVFDDTLLFLLNNYLYKVGFNRSTLQETVTQKMLEFV